MPASRLAHRLTGRAAAKSSRRHRAATAAASPMAPKEPQAGDPQTVGLQADYLLGFDPDRGRSPALGRMLVCLLPALRALDIIQPPRHRNTSISSWRRCVSAVGSESWRHQTQSFRETPRCSRLPSVLGSHGALERRPGALGDRAVSGRASALAWLGAGVAAAAARACVPWLLCCSVPAWRQR